MAITRRIACIKMIEVINFILGIIFVLGAGYFAYMSSVLVSEKKARQRAGITDYYDQPIKKENEQN
jgi:hypothetical protein